MEVLPPCVYVLPKLCLLVERECGERPYRSERENKRDREREREWEGEKKRWAGDIERLYIHCCVLELILLYSCLGIVCTT